MIFDHDGTILVHPDNTMTFGTQLQSNIVFYHEYPDYETFEESDRDWYYDKTHKKIIITSETDLYSVDKHWHFMCELK